MSELELKFVTLDLDEKNHCCNIYNNMKYRGWYRYDLEEEEHTDIICRFRLPPAIHLYDHILRKFDQLERKIGIHRMLIGKDLMVETQELLKKYDNDISRCVADLEEDEVDNLLKRMENLITFDCNKIPYLHIRLYKGLEDLLEFNIDDKIKEFILSHPRYLDIFYNVINGKISISKAEELSNKVIENEFNNVERKQNA